MWYCDGKESGKMFFVALHLPKDFLVVAHFTAFTKMLFG